MRRRDFITAIAGSTLAWPLASVWVVDPASKTVALRAVEIMRYEPSAVIIANGLRDGEVVVTAGVNVLHPGQKVKLLSGAS